MLFDKNLTSLISFVKNMNEDDKNKLKDISSKLSKLDDKNKTKLFQILYNEFQKQFNRITICNFT